VLAGLPRLGPYVFGPDGTRPLTSLSYFKRKLDEASGVTDYRLHDLRRTSRSLMSRAGVIREHAEECLGHARPGVVGTYDRHGYRSEKQLAFERIAKLIERMVDPPADNIITLTAR
jgi:integrase